MIPRLVPVCLALGVLSAQVPFPQAFRYQSISLSGYPNFIPVAINDRGEIVGYFRGADGFLHGILRSASGAVTQVDVPGSFDTELSAINNNGEAAGTYNSASGGFLRLANGTIVLRNVPPGASMRLNAINSQRRITGVYGLHALIFEPDGTFSFFDTNPPNPLIAARNGTVGSVGNAIDDNGQILGSWGTYLGAGIQLNGCFARSPAGAISYLNGCNTIFGGNNNHLLLSNLSNSERPSIADLDGRRSYQTGTISGINNLNSIVGIDENGVPFLGTPCPAAIAPPSQAIGASGGTVTVQVNTGAGCKWGAGTAPGGFTSEYTTSGTGSGTFTMTVPPHTASVAPRSQVFYIAGTPFTVTQSGAPCVVAFNAPSISFAYPGGYVGVPVSAPEGCSWAASSSETWVQLTIASGTGTARIEFAVATNPTPSGRTATVTIGAQTLLIIQAGSGCTYAVTPATVNLPASQGGGTITVSTGPSCAWTVSSNVSWITTAPGGSTGNGVVNFTVGDNSTGNPRIATLFVAGTAIAVSQQGSSVSGLSFVPVPPCRLMDTRTSEGKTGPFGPPFLGGNSTREIPVPTGSCSIPPYARAYSMNITVVPRQPLSYLTLFPTGRAQPNASTLNAFEGQIIANAAIVPAGNNGAISVFVTGDTELIIDINGYFADPSTPNSLVFYPIAPCRLIDTRTGSGGPAGAFGPPSLTGGVARSFPVRSSACGVPANAGAYAVNLTLVPGQPIDYITAWPTGQPRPLVSVQNSPSGRVLANAAIVPAGTNGEISLFAPQPTDVVVDINGYFAPPGQPGGLRLYPVTPCRLADTRDGYGFTGTQGPPAIAGQVSRRFTAAGLCGVDATAHALSLNLTVVPPAYLGFVTLYPGPDRPFVSTLNAWEGQVAANAALVPADTAGGVTAYVSNTTQLILDINGYFAP